MLNLKNLLYAFLIERRKAILNIYFGGEGEK